MKKVFFVLSVVFILNAGNVFAYPGYGSKEGFSEEALAEHKQQYIDQKVENLTSKLGLSDEQQAQLRSILDEKWQKKMEIKKSTHEKMEALGSETQDKIRGILSDDQKGKYEEHLKEKDEDMKGSHKGSMKDGDKGSRKKDKKGSDK